MIKKIWLLLILSINIYSQNTTWNLTDDVLDPVKRTRWKIFYQNNGNISLGDGRIAVLVNRDGNPSTTEIQLTPTSGYRVGAAWYAVPLNLSICRTWTVSFDFRAWGTTSGNPADGVVFAFLRNTPTSPVVGEGIGIPQNNEGFAIVYDTWANASGNTTRVPLIEIQEITQANGYKETRVPTAGNISYIPGGRGYALGINSHNISRGRKYIRCKVVYGAGVINLSYFIESSTGGTWTEIKLPSHAVSQSYLYPGYFYFSSATGGANDEHSIRNVQISLDKDTIFNSRVAFSCGGNTTNLDGGIGYDTYQWQELGSNTIISTNQILTNAKESTYILKKNSTCNYTIDTIKVEKFNTSAIPNPIANQVDTIIYDPFTGNQVMEVYLCGNSTKKLTVVNNDAHQVRWYRNNSLLTTGNTITLSMAGDYRLEIEFRAADGTLCQVDYNFVVYKSTITPNFFLELSNCNNGKENKVTIIDAPNCDFSLDGIIYQSSNVFNLGNVNGVFTIYAKDRVGGCIYPINNIITSEYKDLNINVVANHQKCSDINDGSFDIKIEGGRKPYNLYQKINNGSFSLIQSSINIEELNILVSNLNSTSENHTFKIVDNTSCEIISNPTEIRKPEPLKFDVEITNNSCYQIDDGKIKIKNIKGGTPPYEYSIDGGNVYYKNSEFFNLVGSIWPGTNYPILVRDSNLCVSSIKNISIVKPELDTISYITTKLDCHNGNNASIQILHPIGNSYKYSIDNVNFFSSNIFNNLTFGTYTVYAKDTSKPNICMINKDIIIENPKKVVSSINVIAYLTCASMQDIEVNVTGGTPPYSFSFDGGYQYNLDNKFTYNFPGNYSVYVKDALGCMADVVYIDVVNTATFISLDLNIGTNGTKCPGDIENTFISNIITAISNPNIDPLIILDSIKIFKQPATSNSDLIAMVTNRNDIPLFNVNDTTEVKFVIYNGGCTFSIDTIIKPIVNPLSISKKKDVNCKDGSDGQLVISYGDNDSLLKFPMNVIIENLDNNTINTLILNFKNDTIISNLTAGQYKITVIDANNCKTEFLGKDVLLIQPSINLQLLSYNTINPKSCYNNGSIELNVIGGWGSYKYRLIDNVTKDTIRHFESFKIFPNLDEGSYYIEISDLLGCIISENIILKRENKFSTTKDSTDVKCYNNNDGTITIKAKNIKSPVSYKIEGPISIDYVSVADITYTYNNLSPGKYYVYIKDYYGCEKKDSVVISEPTELILDSLEHIKKVVCQGDTLKVKIHAQGGFSKGGIYEYGIKKDLGIISWQGNNNIFEVSDSAKYTFYVRDSNMCEKYIEYHFNPPTELILEDIIETSKIFCLGDHSASVMLSNVYGGISPYKTRLYKDGNLVDPTYINNKYNYDNLNAGKYKIEVEDALGCTKQSNEIEFKDPPLFVLDSIKTTDLTCHGGLSGRLGTVTSYVSGGTPPYQYNIGTQKWSDDSLISYINVGNYTLTVRDTNGCVVSTTFEIKEPLELKLNTDYISNVSCKGGSDGVVYYSVEGGTPPYTVKFDSYLPPFSYSTNLNSNDPTNKIRDTIKNLKSTSYGIFTLTDASGCSVNEDIKVLEPSLELTYDIDSVRIKCKDDSNGELSIKNVLGGWSNNYEYSLYDKGSNNFIHDWGTTKVFNNLRAGNYRIGVKSKRAGDTLSCILYKEVVLKNPEHLEAKVKIGINDSIRCFGEEGKITLEIQGGEGPYTISDNRGIYNNIKVNEISTHLLKSGEVFFRIKDSRGCEITSDTLNNKEPKKLEIKKIEIEKPLCYKPLLEVIVDSIDGGRKGYEYRYESLDGVHKSNYSSNNKFDLKDSEYYRIYVRDRIYNGQYCETFQEIFVKGKEELDIIIHSSYNCETLEYTIHLDGKGGTPPYSFNATNYKNSTPMVLNGNTFTCFEGDFDIEIIDKNNCNNTTFLSRIKYDKLELFTDMGDGYMNLWVKGGRPDILLKHSYKREFLVNGTYRFNWESKDTITVYDNRENEDIKDNYDIFDTSYCSIKRVVDVVYPFEVPNFFTPDGDGLNDFLEVIYTDNPNLTLEEKRVAFKREFPNSIIMIFDKMGSLISKYKGKDKGWDGNKNGFPMPSDDYWFTVTFPEGHTLKGAFRLTRR